MPSYSKYAKYTPFFPPAFGVLSGALGYCISQFSEDPKFIMDTCVAGGALIGFTLALGVLCDTLFEEDSDKENHLKLI